MSRLRILYLVGARHCGSTLLDAILGNAPGAFSLGEVAGFHRYRSAAACDCGEAPATCHPCRAVVAALETNGDTATFRRVGPLPLKERRAHWTVMASSDRAEYARVADLVFATVAEATGSDALIDSSKNVGRAAALVHDGRYDVRVLHVVRDGRGYLASRRRRAHAAGRRRWAGADFAEWAAKNLLISSLLRRGLRPDRYLLCRYEDLVRYPSTELCRIGRFAGLDTTGLAEAAAGDGVARTHLFEPARRVDYRVVKLDGARLTSQRLSPAGNVRYWACGGMISARWGYDLRQSYLDGAARTGD